MEKEITIHSSNLAWKIMWTEEPDRLQSMGSQRVGHNWVTSLSLSSCFGITEWKKNENSLLIENNSLIITSPKSWQWTNNLYSILIKNGHHRAMVYLCLHKTWEMCQLLLQRLLVPLRKLHPNTSHKKFILLYFDGFCLYHRIK